MRISLIAAVARGGVIGAKGALAWRIRDDFQWFKDVTMGKPMVMGRKTFESIGKALPGRESIVITRAADFSAPDVRVARDIDSALDMAKSWAQANGADEICIIGGAEIYAQTLACADRIYLTRVDADVEGDAYFPDIDEAQWAQRREGGARKNERNQYACDFFILDRIT